MTEPPKPGGGAPVRHVSRAPGAAARFIAGLSWADLPAEVVAKAKLCLADTLAAAIAGRVTRSSAIATTFSNGIIGVGIPKTNTQLRDAVQKSLQSLIDDGTYMQILNKYGEGSLAVNSAQINQGK